MKLAVTGTSAAVVGAVDNFAVSLFNVPLSVIILAAAGCLLSYAYDGSPEHTQKKKFYLSVLANTFSSCAAVSVVPHWFGWEWYSDKMEGSMAFLFGLSSRFAIPFFFKLMPEIIRRWFRVGEYKDIPERESSTSYNEYERYERLPDDFK